ncbi:nucleotidyltransferase family protein [Thermodesulfobacteriota bacterium]
METISQSKEMMTPLELTNLIHCIARTHLRKRDKAYIEYSIKKDIRWDHFLKLADHEGLEGLLYHHLKALDLLSHIPKSSLMVLEKRILEIIQHNLTSLTAARDIAALLAEIKMPGIALQGLSVMKFYGDPALRPMSDVDFMVQPGHEEKFLQSLMQSGYHAPYAVYPNLLYKNGVLLDVHTHLLNLDRIQARRYLFPQNLTPMWERALPYFDHNEYLLALDPYDNIIALAAHALKHGYSRLIWLVDLHESLLKIEGGGEESWAKLVQRTKDWRQDRVVLYALIQIEDFFGLRVPFKAKRDLGLHRLNMVEKHGLRLKIRGSSLNEFSILLSLFSVRGFGSKIKFLLENLFPRRQIMSQIFPRDTHVVKRTDYFKRLFNIATLLLKNLHNTIGRNLWIS